MPSNRPFSRNGITFREDPKGEYGPTDIHSRDKKLLILMVLVVIGLWFWSQHSSTTPVAQPAKTSLHRVTSTGKAVERGSKRVTGESRSPVAAPVPYQALQERASVVGTRASNRAIQEGHAVTRAIILARTGPIKTVRVGGYSYKCARSLAPSTIPKPVLPLGALPTPGQSICPTGEAPLSTSVDANGAVPQPAPPVTSTANKDGSPELHYGGAYYYAQQSTEIEDATGFGGYASDQVSSLDPTDPGDHSITQLWALEYGPDGETFSDIELGVMSDAYFNNGRPTLISFYFDGSQQGCFNGCGFVQVANTVGDVVGYPVTDAAPLLQAGPTHLYQVYENPSVPGEWWEAIDGTPIGYYPAGTWKIQPFTYLNEVEAGGEVETSPSITPQVSMGDGYLGSDATYNEAQPAYWGSLQAVLNGTWQTPDLSTIGSVVNAPTSYNVGQITNPGQTSNPLAPIGSWSFSYGGPGYCTNLSTACSAQEAIPGSPLPPISTKPPKKHGKKTHKHKKQTKHRTKAHKPRK